MMPAKIDLKVSGLSHKALEDALINSGLIVEKKTYTVDGETIRSLSGGRVLNMARIKAGTFQNMRSGLTLRLDPTMIPPSTLTALIHALTR
jgi:hypothetical protein